jgi:hypothetical protein
MTIKIGVLLLILLTFLIVVYFSSQEEGMCSLETVTEESDIIVYYGEFGSVRVRVMENGDKIIVGAVKKDSTAMDNIRHTLYGPDGESITIFKSEDGEFLVINEESIENNNHDNDIITYYGNNGSITVRYNEEDGSKTIIKNKTSYSNDSTSINTYYGPNGNSIDVIRTPDGNLRIITDGDASVYVKPRNNFIRKTEIVPPVCPICPSITSCATTPESTCDNNKTEESNINILQGPNGGVVVQGPDGGVAVQGPNEDTILKDSNGNITTRDVEGNSISNSGKVGMYLGDNSIVSDPMPVLNNFSSF